MQPLHIERDPYTPFRVEPYAARWGWVVDPNVVDATKRRVGATPACVELDHGDHTAIVSWVPVDGAPGGPFTVESLFPLTVVEPVTCAVCRITGRIEAGAWIPTKGGERG